VSDVATTAKLVFEEFPDLASPLTHQGEHDHIGSGVACQHRQERRFADA
jgi:hypothetical protein